jgi:hypothetical protein
MRDRCCWCGWSDSALRRSKFGHLDISDHFRVGGVVEYIYGLYNRNNYDDRAVVSASAWAGSVATCVLRDATSAR